MLKAFLMIAVVVVLAGCKPIEGKRFWWDDQKKEELPNTYELPEWPAASPVPTDPDPYVPKQLPADEIKRATAEQNRKIAAGIPRVGVDDPNANPVKAKVAKWQDMDGLEEDSVEVDDDNGKISITGDQVQEKDGNFEVETESVTVDEKSLPGGNAATALPKAAVKASPDVER